MINDIKKEHTHLKAYVNILIIQYIFNKAQLVGEASSIKPNNNKQDFHEMHLLSVKTGACK